MADPGSEWAIWEPISVSEVTPLVNKLWCYPSIEKPPKKGYKLTVDEARISCKVSNSCYVAGVVGYVITDALVRGINRRVARLTTVSIDDRFLKDVMSVIGSYLAATYDTEYLIGDNSQRPNLVGIEDV